MKLFFNLFFKLFLIFSIFELSLCSIGQDIEEDAQNKDCAVSILVCIDNSTVCLKKSDDDLSCNGLNFNQLLIDSHKIFASERNSEKSKSQRLKFLKYSHTHMLSEKKGQQGIDDVNRKLETHKSHHSTFIAKCLQKAETYSTINPADVKRGTVSTIVVFLTNNNFNTETIEPKDSVISQIESSHHSGPHRFNAKNILTTSNPNLVANHISLRVRRSCNIKNGKNGENEAKYLPSKKEKQQKKDKINSSTTKAVPLNKDMKNKESSIKKKQIWDKYTQMPNSSSHFGKNYHNQGNNNISATTVNSNNGSNTNSSKNGDQKGTMDKGHKNGKTSIDGSASIGGKGGLDLNGGLDINGGISTGLGDGDLSAEAKLCISNKECDKFGVKTCSDSEGCICKKGYDGSKCENWECSNLNCNQKNTENCDVEKNECFCKQNQSGQFCDIDSCVLNNCVKENTIECQADKCICKNGLNSSDCSNISSSNSKNMTTSTPTNNSNHDIKFEENISGNRRKKIILAILIPLFIIILILLLILAVVLYKRRNKQPKDFSVDPEEDRALQDGLLYDGGDDLDVGNTTIAITEGKTAAENKEEDKKESELGNVKSEDEIEFDAARFESLSGGFSIAKEQEKLLQDL